MKKELEVKKQVQAPSASPKMFKVRGRYYKTLTNAQRLKMFEDYLKSSTDKTLRKLYFKLTACILVCDMDYEKAFNVILRSEDDDDARLILELIKFCEVHTFQEPVIRDKNGVIVNK